eukprot:2285047-Pyramimonas_sp.AAC.1
MQAHLPVLRGATPWRCTRQTTPRHLRPFLLGSEPSLVENTTTGATAWSSRPPFLPSFLPPPPPPLIFFLSAVANVDMRTAIARGKPYQPTAIPTAAHFSPIS